LLLRGQEALFGHFAPSTTAVVELSLAIFQTVSLGTSVNRPVLTSRPG
jgi:hypothetical protein